MRRQTSIRRKICRGMLSFTLLEMAAVVVVISILAALSMRFISGGNDQLLPKETWLLKSHLRYAQARAMSGSDSVWSVVIQSDRYTLHQDGSPSSVNWPGESSSEHILESSVQVAGGTGTVTFDVWGSPGESDSVISLTDGDGTQDITVTAMTGFIP